MGKWLQSNEHLTFEVRERVARITLNRPDRRNALSWEMLSELRAALLEADDLRSVSVIVLGGAGPDFCAGYDMKSAYARYAAEGDAALAPQRAIEGTDLAADQRIERARLRRVERTCCRECCGG
jgi:enoyl-CoA hydratase